MEQCQQCQRWSVERTEEGDLYCHHFATCGYRRSKKDDDRMMTLVQLNRKLDDEVKDVARSRDDAQRALDAEREKVKELEQEGLQLFEWRLALHSLTPGGSEFCTPEACESWVRKSRASQHEYIIEQIKQRKELQAQLATLQAQLRQVEGDRQTLQQLVSALPVVDVQEVSVWLSPDESGWLVSKRPAFPAGLYWAKFRTQAEADSFRALLAYRATLAAKDAGKERHE